MRASRWFTQTCLDHSFPLPVDAPFATRDALAAGVTARELTLLCREGLLRTPIKGVYVAAQVRDDTAHRLACLRLVTPPDAIVVDRHAGWAQGADMLLHPNEHLDAMPIAMFLPHGRGRLRNKLAESGERTFDDRDLIEAGGVRMTTPLRTALDLGRQRWPEPALTALDALHRLGAFGVGELLSEVGRFSRMRWVTTLRLVAPHTDGRAQSGGETVVRWRWLQLPVPPPEPQVEVRVNGRVAFVDVGNEALRFGVEFQGVEWHTGAHADDDEVRFGWLRQDADWLVEPAWSADVYGPDRRIDDIILDGVRRARRRRAA
ncbi:type IV toxin-antitoxin system AbiEi family antitoxin domain-containing protein [Nocardioides sp. zg-1228]|uniref:type IV toxin-antitoxin system AbiEi family antitoxin domain-containing protein n=1 Tax=Nocardioides sp. zg-1228 TaxID=2763008 RepID=UPI0016428E71|nr:type IV toxin-antitoxin system AbiEi family antitoxin domain-containing protein [Nocardioides sp. zg-1228]MBC2935014.1 type IV toxin-antitoxin system AbiEi family antitoxin domain-containing protein [Nocardioides sp. zg-1228]QSF56186.1 type IV toxin-antitoxin system AbiEi family antitoxin domain-containing protein [Nocardioides sp. zg-1228]